MPLRNKGVDPDTHQQEQKISHAGFEHLDMNTDKDFDWRKALQVMKDVKDINAVASTSQTELHTVIETDKPIALCFTSDWHLGSLATNYEAWLAHINYILETPNLYMASVGDLIEDSKSFFSLAAVLSQAISPKMQGKVLGKILQELSENKKIVAGWWGNHDQDRDNKLMGQSLVEDQFGRTGIPYFNGIGELHLTVGEVEYSIVGTHKSRFNSMLNIHHGTQALHKMQYPNSDIVVSAHTHSPGVAQEVRYGREVLFVKTGSHKRDDTFTKQYFPLGEIGIPTVVLDPHRKEMIPFWNPVFAVRYINGLRK